MNIRLSWFLIFDILSIAIWVITTYLQFNIITEEKNLFLFTLDASFSNVIVLFGTLMLAIFVKYLVEPKLNDFQIRYLLALFFMIVGIYLIHIVGGIMGDLSIVNTALEVANILNPIMVLSIAIFIGKDLNKLLAENLSTSQRQQVKNLRAAIYIGLFGVIPPIILAQIFDRQILASAYVVITVAVLFLVRTYLIDPRIAFILPEKTYLIIIVNSYGSLTYSKSFSEKNKDEASEVLISGALNAVGALMSEFYKQKVNPAMIKFEDQLILFKNTPYYFIAVFTDRESRLIRNAMDNTAKELEKKYGNKLKQAMESSVMLKIDDIFEKTFYFIYR